MALMRQSILRMTRSRLFTAFVDLLERMDDTSTNLLRIVTYHRVDEFDRRPHLYPGMISATPENFRRQMEHLRRHCRVLSVWEVLAAIRNRNPLPPRSVLITFDDAYQDFAEQAWPILSEFDLPVTLFVPTAFPDDPGRRFWWDRLYKTLCGSVGTVRLTTPWHKTVDLNNDPTRNLRLFRRLRNHLKSLPHEEAMKWVDAICLPVEGMPANRPPETNDVLSWTELVELASQGVTLAPHTQTHPLLNRVSSQVVHREAVGSYRDLRQRVSHVPRVLAYPAGGVNQAAAETLKAAGFQLAMTTQRGLNAISQADPWELKRINVGSSTALDLFRAQLLSQMRHLTRRIP